MLASVPGDHGGASSEVTTCGRGDIVKLDYNWDQNYLPYSVLAGSATTNVLQDRRLGSTNKWHVTEPTNEWHVTEPTNERHVT